MRALSTGQAPVYLRVALLYGLALTLALAIGLLLIAMMGVPLVDALQGFLDGAFGSPYSVAASLNRAVSFALVGIGFIFASRAGLTNIGGEGQICVGGITATAIALYGGVSGLPYGLAYLLPLLAAVAAGLVWGGFAATLKIVSGASEVITTLLLSFIGVWLLYWTVQSPSLLRQPMTSSSTLPESLEIPVATALPLVTGDPSFPLNLGMPIAVVLALVIALILGATTLGLRMRISGLNPVAAFRAGIAISTTTLLALCVAGALGGLAGGIMLLGDQQVLKAGFSSGYGFDGLVAGLLGRGSVIGVAIAAIMLGVLRSGGIGMEMMSGVPSAIVEVIQGLVVIAAAGAAYFDRRFVS